ncbi:M14 family metallopeptidase [uncultured Clostridium sp.]|uniref:M14 family metallopeptidase n=1 Tax=uncultured Clostridium sp. TaxID=59620 RepID=UPI0025D93DE0|nr:M14 family metallopeptidase [uncultured Clostridium sp.]
MKKEVIFQLNSLYRDDFRVTGYKFGKGHKTACIVGAMRGNEVQQLYTCSQLISELEILEKRGYIAKNNEILVIPCVNNYAMNIGKRFWTSDNRDINRMFSKNESPCTAKIIAQNVFENIKEYSYGIQFASFYMKGTFIPHVRMMKTGHESPNLANLFGLKYVLIREPNSFETSTLNYNWQMLNTNAFSIYTNATEHIDEKSAQHAVVAVLRFLTRIGIVKYNCHNGYIASLINEEDLNNVVSHTSGIYRRLKNPGDEVEKGELLAEILDPYEGNVISKIISPIDGVIFFAHVSPLIMENIVAYKIIERIYE